MASNVRDGSRTGGWTGVRGVIKAKKGGSVPFPELAVLPNEASSSPLSFPNHHDLDFIIIVQPWNSPDPSVLGGGGGVG